MTVEEIQEADLIQSMQEEAQDEEADLQDWLTMFKAGICLD